MFLRDWILFMRLFISPDFAVVAQPHKIINKSHVKNESRFNSGFTIRKGIEGTGIKEFEGVESNISNYIYDPQVTKINLIRHCASANEIWLALNQRATSCFFHVFLRIFLNSLKRTPSYLKRFLSMKSHVQVSNIRAFQTLLTIEMNTVLTSK